MVNVAVPIGLAGDLLQYLQQSRDAVLRGLDGLDDYDARRPLTLSGTNILGLVKHLAGVEMSRLGECVGRPSPVRLPWVEDGSIWDGADMWATADQSRDYIVGLYHQAWMHSNTSISELPLDAPARVSEWPAERRETTLGHLVVRVVAETAQHAGHIDILRESIDGQAGRDHDDIGDAEYRARYVAQIQAAADTYRLLTAFDIAAAVVAILRPPTVRWPPPFTAAPREPPSPCGHPEGQQQSPADDRDHPSPTRALPSR